MENERIKTSLSDDIDVYITRCSSPLKLIYEVENTSFKCVHFTLSIEACKNFAFDQDGANGKTITVAVNPCKLTKICSIVRVDRLSKSELAVTYSWVYKDVNQSVLKALVLANENLIDQAIESCQRVLEASLLESYLLNAALRRGIGERDSQTIFGEIVSKLKASNCKFVDSSFPPVAASIGSSISQSLSLQKFVAWRRPEEFLDTLYSIEVFKDEICPNDIKQGSI